MGNCAPEPGESGLKGIFINALNSGAVSHPFSLHGALVWIRCNELF